MRTKISRADLELEGILESLVQGGLFAGRSALLCNVPAPLLEACAMMHREQSTRLMCDRCVEAEIMGDRHMETETHSSPQSPAPSYILEDTETRGTFKSRNQGWHI